MNATNHNSPHHDKLENVSGFNLSFHHKPANEGSDRDIYQKKNPNFIFRSRELRNLYSGESFVVHETLREIVYWKTLL